MNRDEWIQKLKKMGLSGYEAQVYLALLGETRAPASRVVRKSGVPQSKVYGALTSLVERGFAEQVLGDVKLFRGIPPEQAFENYRRTIEDSLTEARAHMAELSSVAPDAPGDDPGSLGIRLVRSQQIKALIDEAVESAESEVLIAVKDPLVMPPDIEQDKRVLARGVKLKQVVEKSLLHDPVHGAATLQEAEETDTVRFIEHVPLRFLVVDRRLAMMELNEEDGSTMALVVPNKGLAENMRRLFSTLWAQGEAPDQIPESFREEVGTRE